MINEINFSMNYIAKKLCRNIFVPRINMKGIVITTEQRKNSQCVTGNVDVSTWMKSFQEAWKQQTNKPMQTTNQVSREDGGF